MTIADVVYAAISSAESAIKIDVKLSAMDPKRARSRLTVAYGHEVSKKTTEQTSMTVLEIQSPLTCQYICKNEDVK